MENLRKALGLREVSVEQITNLRKALDKRTERLEKSKYTKRTGSPGHYKYEYGEKKGKKIYYGKESGKKDSEKTKGFTPRDKFFEEMSEYTEGAMGMASDGNIYSTSANEGEVEVWKAELKPSGKVVTSWKDTGDIDSDKLFADIDEGTTAVANALKDFANKSKGKWVKQHTFNSVAEYEKEMDAEKREASGDEETNPPADKGRKIPKEVSAIVKRVDEGGYESAGITKGGHIITTIMGTGDEWYLNRIIPQKDGRFLLETYSTQENNNESADANEKMLMGQEGTTKKTSGRLLSKEKLIESLEEDYPGEEED